MKIRSTKILVASLVLASAVLHGQYVGPTYRSLQFRIYGKNAKPVNKKNGDYKVSVDLNSEKAKRVKVSDYYFYGDTLNVTVSDHYTLDQPVKLTIGHGAETMVLESIWGMDSVPFTPGQYAIPDGFDNLFEKNSLLRKLRITNRDLANFKVPHGNLAALDLTEKLRGRFMPGYCYSKKDKTMMFIEQYENKAYRFVISNNNGSDWNYVFTPVIKYADEVKQLEASHGHIFLILERTASEREQEASRDFIPPWPVVIKCDTKGNTRIDSVLTGLRVYSLKFISEQVGFAIGGYKYYTSNFYRTLNGGKTWELMYNNISADQARIMYFSDAQHGIILAKRRDNVDYYNTSDAGRSWEKYIPPVRQLSGSGDDPAVIQRTQNIHSLFEEPHVMLVSKDHTLYQPYPVMTKTWRILSPGKDVSWIFCSNYALCSSDKRRTWKYIAYHFIMNKDEPRWMYDGNIMGVELLDGDQLLLYSDDAIYFSRLKD